MRITNQMMTNTFMTNINRNLGILDKYNTQGSSGKKIQNPSDDPIIATRSLKFRTMISETEQYYKNTEQAGSWLEATETALKNINEITDKMKGLMQQGASDTYGVEDRKKLLTEFGSLTKQLEQELNTTHTGRYVFSGFRTDSPVITQNAAGQNILNNQIYGDPTAVPPIVSIDGQNIEIQIGMGISTGVNSLATNLYSEGDYNTFNDLAAQADFIGSPAYQAMTPAQQMAYDRNLRDGMSEMITFMDSYRDKTSVENTLVGVRAKRIELVQTRLQDDKTNYSKLMSDNENANLAEVTMNFNTANAAYQASLKIGMNINQMTLADYLR